MRPMADRQPRPERLPALCAVTPDLSRDRCDRFLEILELCLCGGLRLLYLRSRRLAAREYMLLAARAADSCRKHGAAMLLDSRHCREGTLPPDAGLQLSGERLWRPVTHPGGWLGASCHNATEVEQANRLGADLVLLSPVLPTATHPGAPPLGWDGFRRLADRAHASAYALGGMRPTDLSAARQCGGHGIAMCGGVWEAPDPALAIRNCRNPPPAAETFTP